MRDWFKRHSRHMPDHLFVLSNRTIKPDRETPQSLIRNCQDFFRKITVWAQNTQNNSEPLLRPHSAKFVITARRKYSQPTILQKGQISEISNSEKPAKWQRCWWVCKSIVTAHHIKQRELEGLNNMCDGIEGGMAATSLGVVYYNCQYTAVEIPRTFNIHHENVRWYPTFWKFSAIILSTSTLAR